MKCSNCGAEIENGSKFCQYCGSSITSQMLREQEQLNKAGCPKCGSTNVSFNREKQGEMKGKRGTSVIRTTVGVCKDCGYTWQTGNDVPKKRKTWLWVLGWLFIFPVPLTILMLRKKNMKPVSKYGIIAIAWAIYLMIGVNGQSNTPVEKTASDPMVSQIETTSSKAAFEETTVEIPEATTEVIIEATTVATEATTEITSESTSEEPNTDKADIKTVLSLIEMQGLQNFEYHTIDGDETGITMNVGGNGIAAEVTSAKLMGKDQNYKPWADMKDNMIYMCNSTKELLEALGYDDTLVMLNLVNDLNTDNVLLTILNGVVIYDVMAE